MKCHFQLPLTHVGIWTVQFPEDWQVPELNPERVKVGLQVKVAIVLIGNFPNAETPV